MSCVRLAQTGQAHVLTARLRDCCRNAVDFGIALMTNPNLALLWVETLAAKIASGGMQPYQEGQIPEDVKSWREWVPHA